MQPSKSSPKFLANMQPSRTAPPFPSLPRYRSFVPCRRVSASTHCGSVLESDVCTRHDIDAAVVSKLLVNGPRTPFRSCCASSPACLCILWCLKIPGVTCAGVSSFAASHLRLPFLPRHDRISVSVLASGNDSLPMLSMRIQACSGRN